MSRKPIQEFSVETNYRRINMQQHLFICGSSLFYFNYKITALIKLKPVLICRDNWKYSKVLHVTKHHYCHWSPDVIMCRSWLLLETLLPFSSICRERLSQRPREPQPAWPPGSKVSWPLRHYHNSSAAASSRRDRLVFSNMPAGISEAAFKTTVKNKKMYK